MTIEPLGSDRSVSGIGIGSDIGGGEMRFAGAFYGKGSRRASDLFNVLQLLSDQ
jgi:hypothetical protein